MTAKILQFPNLHASTRAALTRIGSLTLELINCDRALAEIEQLMVLCDQRADQLPRGSERWSWEQERWFELLADREFWRQRRLDIEAGGLRVVS